jgi:hypothetical protein
MIRFNTHIVVSLIVFGLFSTIARQSATAGDVCESRAANIKAATAGVRTTAVTFNSNPDRFDRTPLVSTTVQVAGKRSSCLIVHFSAMVGPMDNHVVFQARADGVPIEGHLPGFVGIQTPVVVEPDYADPLSTAVAQFLRADVAQLGVPFANVPQRMVAYNFFTEVKPGQHTVEIFFAGCCSSNPLGSGATISRTVVTLEYRGASSADPDEP